MLCDIVNAEYIKDYKLKVLFEDNKQGIVDFSIYLNKGGVFEKFKDIDFFKNFSVNNELGTIVWNNEIDIAPETIYEKC
jgi:hypothetical protein